MIIFWNRPSVDLIIWAGIALMVLIGLQLILKPNMYKAHVVTTENQVPSAIQANEPSIAPAAQSCPGTQPPKIPARRIELMSGRAVFSMLDWPSVGSVSAKHAVALIFDYACADCRHLRKLLNHAQERYGGQLAVLDLPAPMSPSCNPKVRPRDASHSNACGYARLAWAIWLAMPEKYPAYVDWFLSQASLPTLGAARHEASRLCGVEIFDPSVPDPLLDQRLASALAIFYKLETRTIPALLLPHGVLNGHVDDLNQLLEILHEQLKMMQ